MNIMGYTVIQEFRCYVKQQFSVRTLQKYFVTSKLKDDCFFRNSSTTTMKKLNAPHRQPKNTENKLCLKWLRKSTR